MLQIGWAQALLLFFMLLPVTMAIAKHGERKPEAMQTFNGWAMLVRFCAGIGLLYWGGFFA